MSEERPAIEGWGVEISTPNIKPYKLAPRWLCVWCGEVLTTTDEVKAHSPVCRSNPARQTEAKLEELRRAFERFEHQIEQECAAALGHYPRYSEDPANFPDAVEKDGYCTGEHCAVTILAELCRSHEEWKARALRAGWRPGS